MSWIFESQSVDETVLDDYVGFVYCITNLIDNKKYIGKKLLKFRRSKIVKGKKKKILVESDWKKYWGSNKTLIADVEALGENKFSREILMFCKSKGECNYYEAKFQFECSVLETDKYYNDWIMCKIHRSHVKKLDFSQESSIMRLLG
jgi:hypothetical protein